MRLINAVTRTYAFWRLLRWLDVSLAVVRMLTYGVLTGLVIGQSYLALTPVPFPITMHH